MNIKKDELLLISLQLSSTLTPEELQELARLINPAIGNETQKNQTSTGKKPCKLSENDPQESSNSTYQYYTEKEVAKKLGVCTKQMRKFRKNNEIGYHKIGRQIRYSPEDVREYEMKTRVEAKRKDDPS